MQVFRKLAELGSLGRTIVTVGNFDGVHCGHQAVLARIRGQAAVTGFRSVVVTFSPHPVCVLYPERGLKLITPLEEKLRLLESFGVDAVLALEFTPTFANTTAEAFAREFLRDGFHAAEVYEGENFHFGRGAAGTLASLRTMGQELGFDVHAFEPVLRGGVPVSSSRIRAVIAEGRVSEARHMLGRVFSVVGNTVAGRGVGRGETVPTLNLAPYSELLPGNGVYVTRVSIAGETMDAVTNIGVRPTFGTLDLAVESYALDRTLDSVPQGAPLGIRFFQKLREERKFGSPAELREQIMKDVAHAKRYFSLARSVGATSVD